VGRAKGWIRASPGPTQSRSWCWLGGVRRREVGIVGVMRRPLQCVSEGADASGAPTTYATKPKIIRNFRLPRYRYEVDKSVFRSGNSIHRNVR